MFTGLQGAWMIDKIVDRQLNFAHCCMQELEDKWNLNFDCLFQLPEQYRLMHQMPQKKRKHKKHKKEGPGKEGPLPETTPGEIFSQKQMLLLFCHCSDKFKSLKTFNILNEWVNKWMSLNEYMSEWNNEWKTFPLAAVVSSLIYF